MRTVKQSCALAAALLVVALMPALAAASPPLPSLALAASPATVATGGAVTLTVTSELPGATLTLSRQYAGESSFSLLRAVTTDSGGAAEVKSRPARNATYRIAFAGDVSWSPAAADAAVSVAPQVSLTASGPVYEGARVAFRVSVSPAQQAGGAVELQLRAGGAWTSVRTVSLDAHSKAAFSWVSDRKGRVRFRAVAAAGAEFATGASGTRTVVVKDPNPWHVPSGPAHYIVVDVDSYKLYYHEHGRIVRVLDCVTGKPSTPTPIGHFHIYAKDANIWGPYGPDRMRYLGLYAIHGTDEPWLLNRYPRNFSHGCTRVGNNDIRWLFARCPVGTPVWNVR